MRALARLALVAAALAAGGCTKIRSCKSGSVLISVDGAGVGADAIQVTLTVDGTSRGTSPSFALPASRAGTFELDLGPSYIAGKSAIIDVDALASNVIVGHGEADVTLSAGCSVASVPLTATTGEADLSMAGDLGGAVDDLAGPPDLLTAGPAPSHTTVGFNAAAADLPINITAIDTTNLQYTAGGTMITPGASVFFDDGAGHAVLLAGSWVPQSNIKVYGSRSLIVVAAKAVDLQATIDASATGGQNSALSTPGPGGFTAAMGLGAGGNGVNGTGSWRGGGGGGFGSVGGAGGKFSAATNGGTAGPVNGAMITQFFGGSGGGNGFTFQTTCDGGNGLVPGGAGGGAVQISSLVSITVRSSAGINVGGAGGNGGCDGNSGDGGGGGGSGGMIFLEAPSLQVAGKLAANGGGGGSGPTDVSQGGYGANGGLNATPAAGGTLTNGQPGGNGAAGVTGATAGVCGSGGCGGGGGGVGRIWLRTRTSAADTVGSTISPTPMTDTTF